MTCVRLYALYLLREDSFWEVEKLSLKIMHGPIIAGEEAQKRGRTKTTRRARIRRRR